MSSRDQGRRDVAPTDHPSNDSRTADEQLGTDASEEPADSRRRLNAAPGRSMPMPAERHE